MADQQKKIEDLEKELEQLSLLLLKYRDELTLLKKSSGEEPRQNESAGQARYKIQEPNKSKNTNHKEQPIKKSLSQYMENFIGVRLLHLTGIVVLVIGISIGVKYAVDKELISPTSRIILAYTAGVILYILSVRLKNRFQLFSAILFSGAMASLYFTTYAGFVYYNLFAGSIAFGIMVMITIFTAYTAIRYDRQEIAILGMIGSYGIPFLISSNSDRAELFFTYIILINAGVVFLSYKKTWKAMVRLAMIATWFLFIGWAVTRYKIDLQSQASLFLGIFYIMFALASVGFAINRKEPLGLLEIQLFLLNSILAYFAALMIFTEGRLDNRSVAVTGVACVIFSLQALGTRLFFPKEKLVFSYLTAFAVLSLIFYIGMKWDGLPVTMLWLLIAIGLFAGGVFTKTGWMRLMSIIVTAATLLKLILIDRHSFTTGQKIISYIVIGVILLLLSFFYQKLYKSGADERNSGTPVSQ